MAKKIYGILADFDSPESLLKAVKPARREGYTRVDAFTPFPVEGLTESLGIRHTRISAWVLLCGIAGGCTGYFMQYFASVVHYPLSVGGKPFHSWPAFIPVTFELTVLFAALGAVFGMLAMNGFPMPYHPVFNVPEFERASCDRFFICIESKDPGFDSEKVKQFLRSLKPEGVYEADE